MIAELDKNIYEVNISAMQFVCCLECGQKNCTTIIKQPLRRTINLGTIKKMMVDLGIPDYSPDYQYWWCSVKCWNSFVEKNAHIIVTVMVQDEREPELTVTPPVFNSMYDEENYVKKYIGTNLLNNGGLL